MTNSAKAVRFDHYGGRDVLYVADIPMPVPGSGQVVVAVKAKLTTPLLVLIARTR